MASLNKRSYNQVKTHEGATAVRPNAEEQLRRAVMACFLWESQFYEDGMEISDRIRDLVAKVDNDKVANLAVEARNEMKIRHAPLLLARELARKGYEETRNVLSSIIQRPDEITEFLAIYWKDAKEPLSAQVKKGLSEAFHKFDEYQLAKWNKKNNQIKLRDAMRLVHPKPKSKSQENLFGRLINGELKTPDTWETALSSGENKKQAWERLIDENKLGGMAVLMNLRNMQEAGVSHSYIRQAIQQMNPSRILPFRFISASRFAPMFEQELEEKMLSSTHSLGKFDGTVAIVVDVSGSMSSPLSAKSDLRRRDAAEGLAMVMRELSDNSYIIAFHSTVFNIPPRRGFALRDAIDACGSGGTNLGSAVRRSNELNPDLTIVITDEQSHQRVGPPANKGYIINVASYDRGVGYGNWTHISGFSEAVARYILEMEREFPG